MSSELDIIIGYGNDITSVKLYGVATMSILFYEHFLMLPDEIRYAWSSNKTWVFYLFLINRYIPIAYQFWFLAVSFQQSFSQEFCDKTSFVSFLTFVICTLLAQTVVTLRVYAVTGKSKPVAAAFCVITASQLALGLYIIYLTASHGAQVVPPFPFDAFRICFFARHRKPEIAYTVISLVYDTLAFSVMLYLAGRSTLRKSGIPGILRTLLKDAAGYFFVIFTSHFVLVMTILFTRPSLQLLPGLGVVVYLPVMITRIMISLRKAAYTQGSAWSMGESTFAPSTGREVPLHSMQFASNRTPTKSDTFFSSTAPEV